MARIEGFDKHLAKLIANRTTREIMLAAIPEERRMEGIPPERRMEGIPPERRMAGIPPRRRLAGLDDEQQILALSDTLLRALSRDFVEGLAPQTRRKIARRVGKHTPRH